MREREQIEAFLANKGIELTGPVIVDYDNASKFVAFARVKHSDGRLTPGPYVLNNISREAKANGWDIDFVLVEENTNDLDRSIRTLLFNKFPEETRNSFASQKGKLVEIWIEPKYTIPEETISRISASLSDFVGYLGLTIKSLYVTRNEDIPTDTAILRTLRIIAPSSLQELKSALEARKLTVPNDVWLNHALDKLRKSGEVVRRSNGSYVLTLAALSRLGTAKRGNSPDVSRALALARRGG